MLGVPFPQDPHQQLHGRDRRGLQKLDERARHHLPPCCMTSRRPGARRSTCRRWCSAIWATRSATGVAFTRNPVDRREGALRRVSGQRPGRGCRRRHPHAAVDHRKGAHRGGVRPRRRWKSSCRRPLRSSPNTATGLKRITATCRIWSSPLKTGKLWMLQTRRASAPPRRR
jgi:hypothetical protein